MDEFASAFNNADVLLVMDIYAPVKRRSKASVPRY
jgi:UDP-N-acetylmuramate-alanine ligase